MSEEIIEKTKKFVETSFKKNPSYSFNDWKIMYEHSLLVMLFSLGIAADFDCDKLVLSIGALLHDIGKTYETDQKTLRERHEEFNYEVSKEFLKSLKLTSVQFKEIESLLSKSEESVYGKVIKDADVLAFLADESLQRALKKWADKNNLPEEMKRKLNKFSKAYYPRSITLGEKYYLETKERWHL